MPARPAPARLAWTKGPRNIGDFPAGSSGIATRTGGDRRRVSTADRRRRTHQRRFCARRHPVPASGARRTGSGVSHRQRSAGCRDRGIDLDHQDSRVSGKPAPGTCAHDDFAGAKGERGIDDRLNDPAWMWASTANADPIELSAARVRWRMRLHRQQRSAFPRRGRTGASSNGRF